MPVRVDDGPVFGVLGPIVVRTGRATAGLTPRQQVIVALLAAARGRDVPTDALAEAVWGDRQPADPTAALRNQIARLRRLLGEHAQLVETTAGGYRLACSNDDLDLIGFEQLAKRAQSSTGHQRLALLQQALSLWRGDPYGDWASLDALQADAILLADRHARLVEELAELLLGSGDARGAAQAHELLQELLGAQPQREVARGLLMEALAGKGRHTDALDLYQGWRQELVERGLEPSPELQAIEQRVLRHAAGTATPRWRALLPQPLSALIGRDDDVEAVTDLIRSRRLVTLVGPGGVGKTRLALAAAGALAEHYAGGVWFCDLSSATQGGEVATMIASAVGLREQGREPLLVQLCRQIDTSPTLVVLDNCERVLDGARDAATRLTRHSAAIDVLATSRQRLSADDELVYEVEPLPCKGTASPAVQLFLERRRQADGRAGEPSDGELDLVTGLCARLDGLPLAIELAASTSRTMSIAELARQLPHHHGPLFDPNRFPSRHRSVATAIDWSHRDLDDEHRVAFRRLAVFRGWFDLDAASQLLQRTGLPAAAALRAITDLIDRSLLRRSGEDQRSHYAMLDTVRQYGLDRLNEAGEVDAVREAHAAWAVAFCERAAVGLAGPDEAAWAQEIQRLMDDLRGAVDWSVANGGDKACRIAVALHSYALWRGEFEIYRWAERATASGQSPHHPAALATAASGAWQRGDFDTARTVARAALEAGAAQGQAGRRALEIAGDVAILTGELEEAIARYQEAATLALVANDTAQAVWDQGSVGLAHAYDGRTDQALAACATTLDIAQAAGSPSSIAFAHFAFAESLHIQNPIAAREHLDLAQRLAHQVGSNYLLALIGTTLANVAGHTDQPDALLQRYRDVLRQWQRNGAWTGLAVTLRSLPEVLAAVDAVADAAIILGFVTGSPSGPAPYGRDAERLGAIEDRLRAALGPESLAVLMAQGHRLAPADASSNALNAIENLLGPPPGPTLPHHP